MVVSWQTVYQFVIGSQVPRTLVSRSEMTGIVCLFTLSDVVFHVSSLDCCFMLRTGLVRFFCVAYCIWDQPSIAFSLHLASFWAEFSFHFILITRQLSNARYWHSSSVRPSVYLSVTFDIVSKRLTYHTFSAYSNHFILLFPVVNIFVKFRKGHPPMGVLITGGIYKFSDFLLPRPHSHCGCIAPATKSVTDVSSPEKLLPMKLC